MKQGERRAVDRLVFSLLVFIEFFYRIGFWAWRLVTSTFMPAQKLPSRVIAIGNLSVGGTGKTVFVHFLANLLSHRNLAIITRGYGGSLSTTDKSWIINEGSQLLFSPEQAGDEAFMLAQRLNVPVAVGKNRFISYKTLVNKTGIPAVVLLDDAYQNRHIQKDYEFLLVDARKPFENNHCLPAGPLREKDYSRADCIILTHADKIDQEMLPAIKKKFFPRFDPTKILAGKHAATKIYDSAGNNVDLASLTHHNFLCFAGIGSFSGFISTVEGNGLTIGHTHEFADHYPYTPTDLETLAAHAQLTNSSALITTEKDWVKIAPFIKDNTTLSLPIYILAVEFEFLSSHEYSFFVTDLNRKI